MDKIITEMDEIITVAVKADVVKRNYGKLPSEEKLFLRQLLKTVTLAQFTINHEEHHRKECKAIECKSKHEITENSFKDASKKEYDFIMRRVVYNAYFYTSNDPFHREIVGLETSVFLEFNEKAARLNRDLLKLPHSGFSKVPTLIEWGTSESEYLNFLKCFEVALNWSKNGQVPSEKSKMRIQRKGLEQDFENSLSLHDPQSSQTSTPPVPVHPPTKQKKPKTKPKKKVKKGW